MLGRFEAFKNLHGILAHSKIDKFFLYLDAKFSRNYCLMEKHAELFFLFSKYFSSVA